MVGETVITIGNAFGYENTVSVGIVSALQRNVTLSDEQVYRNLIQTDACINPGNSGGPLINIDGELIGINVAVRAGAQGIGFALPIDDVKEVAAEMMSTRRLASTWHGLVAGEQRNGAKKRIVVSRGPAGQPGRSRRVQARRRAGPGRRPGRGERWTSSAACSTSAPATGPGGDPPRQHRDRHAARRPHRPRRDRQHARPTPTTSSGSCSGIKTQPVSTEYVAAVSPKLRGGLYIQSVSPGSLAAGRHPEGRHPGRHERRHPPLGDDPGRQHPLRPPPARNEPDQSALLYVVRKNGIQPRRISFAESTVRSILGR